MVNVTERSRQSLTVPKRSPTTAIWVLACCDCFRWRRLKRLEASESETAWEFIGTADAFNARLLKPFLAGSDGDVFVAIEVPKTRTATSKVLGSAVGYGAIRNSADYSEETDAGSIVKVESIEWSFVRERLGLPSSSKNRLKSVEVKSVDALNSGLIDSLELNALSE